jgi:hypothetical protein
MRGKKLYCHMIEISSFQLWCKLEVLQDLLMEKMSFLFMLLEWISIRGVVDIELYPNNMYCQNTEDHNVNILHGSILLFVLFLGLPNDFFPQLQK